MAYNINSYLNSRQQSKSAYSPFGGTPGRIGGRGLFTGMFGNKNPKQQFISALSAPKAQTYGISKPATPSTNMSVAPANMSTVSANQSATSPAPKEQFINKVASSSLPASPAVPFSMPENQPTTPTMPEAPKSDPYLTYLQSLFDPEKTSEALTAKEDAMKRLSGIQNDIEIKDLAARREYDAKLDETGGLKSGAEASASASARRSNQELADLAVQETAAARSAQVATDTYNEYINAGKTVYEAEQAAEKARQDAIGEGFTLSSGETRYDSQGNPIAGGSSGFGGGYGSYTQGSDPTTDSWVEYVRNGGKITDVPDEYQSAVLQGSQSLGQNISPTAQKAVSIIDRLAGNEALGIPAMDTKKISGFWRGTPWIAGSKSVSIKAAYDELKAYLRLDNIKYLRGTGAISDAEQKVLEAASKSLNRKLSDQAFVTALEQLRTDLTNANKSSSYQQNGIDQQIRIQLDTALQQGRITQEEYDYVTKQSFNSVGKTTASNIPQKNKNPGNIKRGGLADSLAIGVDRQGHLIFPDEATGFRAMQMDIEAKINGKSRYLPANPTLAQLGKVYAEDPNWSKSVASILRVSPTTNTKLIPINSLVQAIARQEGYYA